jgi:hypothetical protein
VSADFPNNADWMAYEAINACACGNNMINGGCMDSCTFTAAGNPDFCFGASGDATCFDCLMSTCQTEIAACEAN